MVKKHYASKADPSDIDLIIAEQNPRKTHMERIASAIPLPYFWGWGIISGAFLLISLAAVLFLERSFANTVPFLLLSILIFQQSVMIQWAQGQIRLFRDNIVEVADLPKEETIAWYETQEAIIFNDKGMFASAILVYLIEYSIYHFFGFSFSSIYSYVIFGILFYTANYFVGAGAYFLISTALMVHNMGKLPLNINMILSDSIKPKGMFYSKLTICAVSVYLVWGIFTMLTPLGLMFLPSILWYSSFALLLVLYFIITHYSIHQMVIKTKNKYLETFSPDLRAQAIDTFINLRTDNLAILRDMLAIKDQMDRLCQWPFGPYELMHIALIVIIPFLVVTLEIIFKIIE
jgi:hypothetical protein